MNNAKQNQLAVVIGGSVAGLLMACVLADFFKEVIILERDTIPDDAQPRKKVSQENHSHILLDKGISVIESFFPGIIKDLQASGASVADTSRDIAWNIQGVWQGRYTNGHKAILSLRPYFDFTIRKYLLQRHKNVIIRDKCTAAGFLTTTDKTRINGVIMIDKAGRREEITADLTVDAGGRGSKTPEWLKNLGYDAPDTVEIDLQLGYASRRYECPDDFQEDWQFLAIYPKFPGSWRAGTLSKVQNKQWIVTMSGYFGDHAPVDDAGFLAFAKSLRHDAIYNQIKDKVPISDTHVFNTQKCIRRHYEKMTAFPDGLIVTGDAVCVLNPIFGQGISIAAGAAAILQQYLSASTGGGDRLKGLSKKFQRKLAAFTDIPWLVTSTIDLGYPQTKGKRPFGASIAFWVVKNAITLSASNEHVSRDFLKMMHLQGGLNIMLKPSFVFPILFHGIRNGFARSGSKRAGDTVVQREKTGSHT
ncbi:MAG TPA: hypothetical protein VM802_10840 [Chitinophaga sp.]|uniref:NAD(P)/FAD-dependent oxidoreductase n=1 Tax=Chitinophaga sp. TaxID=1869181 RepID=UPI002B7B008A|nr:hypothetical protein [Chitinophaga sp.]HVI45361.1 hypothetical protein [Chitinophaga sp.]